MDTQARAFFDVFPQLNLSKGISDLFEETYIEKVTVIRMENKVVMDLSSNHLISRDYICEVERRIYDEYFRRQGLKICINEHFHLSSQYKLEDIYKEYRDSINKELLSINHIACDHAKRAECFFDGNIITLAMKNSSLAIHYSKSIKDCIENIFASRFGMDVNVGFSFSDEDKDFLRRENEKRVKELLEANAIMGSNEQENTPEQEVPGQQVAAENAKEELAHEAASKEKEPEKDAETNDRKQKRGSRRGISKDPDVFYGRDVDGETTPIESIVDGMGDLVIHGQIVSVDERLLRSGKTLFACNITDFTDTIAFKIFSNEDDTEFFQEELKAGSFYRVKGAPQYDSYSKEVTFQSIKGIKHIPDYREKRMDTAVEKRVELHLHTVMSEMDSVIGIDDLMARASAWGHGAIAITDHGVAQAFPVAAHSKAKSKNLKLIYGCEGYFVDDLKELVIDAKGQLLDTEFVVFDIETTGLSRVTNKIIEIGAVKINGDGKELGRFSEFVNPEVPIPYNIEQLTSITNDDVKDAETIDTILPRFIDFCGEAVVVAHNAAFDTGFIKKNADDLGLSFDNTIMDTMTLAHVLMPNLGKFTLDNICKNLKIVNEHHHRAVDDANATVKVFVKFLDMLKERGVESLEDVNALGKSSDDTIKKARSYHGIILAKNEIGRVNLYRLISESHIRYFNNRPRMPLSLIEKYREGLILGSACEAGQLYQALLNDASDEEIARIVNFYDYLEIQPLGNNEFMTRDGARNQKTMEDLINYNKRIVELGELFNKPVVATCDAHFLDPEDSIYRAIIQKSKGYADANNQAPLFFRTTDEMLAEFNYLGSEKAREVVITNTNLIADMIDEMEPVRPDKAAPVFENSDGELTDICYAKAHEIYGPNLPTVVEERLSRELNSIISNGFAVMYIIAQKLVWDSVDHGYLVGSRGSVGSSFVATMSGITEVNPLSPHYICPKCHYVDFDSEVVIAHSGMSGCDLPDDVCPHCGTELIKEGHDIPFETFLGFKGDKEPDIDLNFSGEYQANAHAYTEELFGKGKAFRAGTIGSVADKTAYGHVYSYFKSMAEDELRLAEPKDDSMTVKAYKEYIEGKAQVTKRRAELERLAIGCTGVKRTTGQHPGGMIVLPSDEEIYSFTPIQHPANKDTPIITSHFEYHSIDHNLLKLDILGHDDPTMIRRLEDLTGTVATKIRLDDKKVMSLFHNTSALGINPEDIHNVKLGSLGIPEFGTDFAMQMLIDAKPTCFSDLVRIAGLAHGTDVWLGNAQDLILSEQCTISTAICCRDDIMVYLIHMGVESGTAFKIMENVRKGIVAKGKCDMWDQWKEDLLAHDVPEWYIGSCEKIKYMFPKAHAVAYVMMAWRVAWYKVNYPLEYYTAYFSIRASGFDYEYMCFGKERVIYHLDRISKIDKNKRTAKDNETYRDLRIVLEMYARGIEFMPIDLYKADDERFLIIDGKIMPSFSSITGLGEAVASVLKNAAAQGEFISKQDMESVDGISKSTVEKLSELGILDGMPETNQLSFDFG